MLSVAGKQQLKLIQTLINQALKLDPLAQQRLEKLADKRIRLQCTEPLIDIIIAISAETIQLHNSDDFLDVEKDQPITCHLMGDMSAYSKLLTAEDKAAALINSELRLQGDSALLIELEQLLSHIELDWEYHLAKLIGDLPAHLIGKTSRKSWQFLRSSQPVFARHLQEFILEEAQLCPNKMEMEQFIDNVQNIHEQVDRLQARVQRLSKQLDTKP